MPKFASNLTFMFNEVDFLDRFAAAAEAGFSGVEYMSPYEYAKDELAGRLERNGLTQVLFNLPAGDWDAGDRGMACHPDRVGEFQDGVAAAIEYATALGCRQVNCLAGIAPQGAVPDVLRETLVSNLGYAAGELRGAGVRLLIEPINTRDMPGFYLRHSAQARSVIDEVGSDNLWLQYDVYHMQVMEGDLTPTIQANLDIIRHIQIADNPGRNEPGTGEINYPFLLDSLDTMGYDGWIGCEYRPLTTTAAGLPWAASYLRPRARGVASRRD
jgi:hydroxypyruvate isomerase